MASVVYLKLLASAFCLSVRNEHIAAGDTYTCLLHHSSAIISQYSHASILHCLSLFACVFFFCVCAVCLSELRLFVSPHMQGWGYFNKISVPHIASCIIHVHWYSAPQNRPLSSDNTRNTRRKKIHFSIQSFSVCICMVNHSHVGSWSINRAHMSLYLDLD